MTIQEAERKIHVQAETLKGYQEQGLLDLGKLSEDNKELDTEMEKIKMIDELAKLGMTPEDLRIMSGYMGQGRQAKERQIRFLKKWRYRMLDDIHARQQSLDRLDYMLHRMTHSEN